MFVLDCPIKAQAITWHYVVNILISFIAASLFPGDVRRCLQCETRCLMSDAMSLSFCSSGEKREEQVVSSCKEIRFYVNSVPKQQKVFRSKLYWAEDN